MKNKIKVATTIALICMLLVSLVACYGDPPTPAAYFENLEDAVNALSSENITLADVTVDDYAFLKLPDDERFVDVDYIFSSMAGIGGPICDHIVFAVYKLNVCGEDIYILAGYISGNDGVAKGYANRDYSRVRYCKIDSFERLDECMHPMTKDYYISPDFVRGFEPKGYIKQFIGFRDHGALEFINENCICFIEQRLGSNEKWFDMESPCWAIYDTRDVPQAEKEALASELMEILYNNYKLAGEKAE